MPKVSIIMPVFNEKHFLKTSISSALAQSIDDIELICCDDGSDDGSFEYLKEIQKNDDRLIVLQQKNLGAGPARNACLDRATGEYVCFLDADDCYIDRHSLEIMYSKMKMNNVSVCCGMLKYNRNGVIEDADYFRMFTNAGDTIISFRELQTDYYFQCFLFERKIIEENNIRFMNLRRYQDPPFLVSVLHKANQILMINESVYLYTANENKINFNYEKTNALLKGLLWELRFAKENGYYNLSELVLKRLNKDFKDKIIQNISFEHSDILSILFEMNNLYDDKQIVLPIFQIMIQMIKGCDFEWERKLLSVKEIYRKNIVLYGAGESGSNFIQKNIINHSVNVVAWIDKYRYGEEKQGIVIQDVTALSKLKYDYVVVAIRNNEVYEQIVKELREKLINPDKIIRWRF